VPSPSFSSCWKELGCRWPLFMVDTTGMIWPSPRLRTLMDESVRWGTARVPACVALSSPGGGRVVKLGSQRMADAVVSWEAMRSVERGSSEVEAEAGAGCAVLEVGVVNERRCYKVVGVYMGPAAMIVIDVVVVGSRLRE